MAVNKLARIIPQVGFISILSLVQVVAATSVVVAQSAPTQPQPTPVAQPTPSSGSTTGSATQSAPASAQTTPQSSAANAQPNPAPVAGPSAEELQKRVERARALAAAHQLGAAARELEYVRALSGGDAAFRDGTSVMLMGIYLEDGNYSRAQSLLEETFQARSQGRDGSLRSFYALSGQAVNGIRLHLARYRNFGVGLESSNLPPEAATDLDRLRTMLERMVAQASDLMRESPRGNDGLALLEDVLGIRSSIPRDSQDRDRWQAEYNQARERLGASRMEIASLRGAPPFVRPSPTPTPALAAPIVVPNNPQPSTTAPAPTPTPANKAQASAPAASNTAQGQPMFVGSLNSRASKKVVPQYPQMAKTARVEGIVRVHVNVSELGEVEVTKSDGPPLLKQAAEDAAKGWKFTPIVVEGKPVRMSGFIDFSFYR